MQAGGRRFEPDRLHQRVLCWRRFRPVCRREECEFGAVGVVWKPRLRCRDASLVGALIFVRVNQVLVRLWARSIAKSDRMVGGFGLRTSSDREGSEARKVPLCPRGCVLPGWVRWILLCAEQMIPSCTEAVLSEDGFCAWCPWVSAWGAISSMRRAFGGCLGTRRR